MEDSKMVVNPSNLHTTTSSMLVSKQDHLSSFATGLCAGCKSSFLSDLQQEFSLRNIQDNVKRVLITGNWWSVP